VLRNLLMRTVIIIDDDSLWLRIISQFFSQNGYLALPAANGDKGIELAKVYHPDCILLDFHLAQENAKSVCVKLRANLSLKTTPVIIVSNDDSMDLTAYRECKAISFVIKLGPMEKILSAVENVITQVHEITGILERGDIRLEPVACAVFRDKVMVAKLTPDQFELLYMLVGSNSSFLSEEEISRRMLDSDSSPANSDSIRGIAYRIRKALGPQLGRRIKSSSTGGWIYVQPPKRKKIVRVNRD